MKSKIPTKEIYAALECDLDCISHRTNVLCKRGLMNDSDRMWICELLSKIHYILERKNSIGKQ